MFDSQVIAFTVVAFMLTLTPGADTLLVIRSALIGGKHNGMATAWGICFGLFVHAALSAIGVSVLILHSALVFNLLKSAGAAYLFWIGCVSIYRATRRYEPIPQDTYGEFQTISPTRSFIQGLLCNVLNPKVAVFYLALLPQFLSPEDPVFAKSMLLALIHFFEALIWLMCLSFMVERLGRLLKNQVFISSLEGLTGIIFVAIGIRLAFHNI